MKLKQSKLLRDSSSTEAEFNDDMGGDGHVTVYPAECVLLTRARKIVTDDVLELKHVLAAVGFCGGPGNAIIIDMAG